nr:immunoglobulin light chain junction region [Macaca mulatta]MOX69666.1 immunoglobulin light chain junction region [Macaca mulatta]MOX70183.1 immunoglobulin light chain junction region [Macaca mulatta]MOX70396.1 immunoglobulin light chain junction region [Macaca mulatta]MOX71472.1 immunoglobulin light chain junction region [Macaca mulatta]
DYYCFSYRSGSTLVF